jgi:hypothetical protein
MAPKAKYNSAFRVAQEIANSLKSMRQSEFTTGLEAFRNFLNNKEDFMVVRKSEIDNVLDTTVREDKTDDDDDTASITSSQSSTSFVVRNENRSW